MYNGWVLLLIKKPILKLVAGGNERIKLRTGHSLLNDLFLGYLLRNEDIDVAGFIKEKMLKFTF